MAIATTEKSINDLAVAAEGSWAVGCCAVHAQHRIPSSGIQLAARCDRYCKPRIRRSEGISVAPSLKLIFTSFYAGAVPRSAWRQESPAHISIQPGLTWKIG